MSLDKKDWSFMDRYRIATYMGCKSCENCQSPELQYYTGNEPDSKGKFCNLSMDTRINLILQHRTFCRDFQTERDIERDTTYPGSTFAPHDNNHPHLKADNTDIEDYEKPQRCLGQYSPPAEFVQKNEWDLCLKELFDRKRKVKFPSNTKVMELLNNSFIPQQTFRIGLPPQKGMGFDRGLWFYHSEKYNFSLDKNKNLKREMKKIIMVYLYHVWFKHLTDDQKEGILMALESANKYSLARDLSWWIGVAFKDPLYLVLHPPVEDDIEIEFVRISLMDKALEAEMLAKTSLTSYELDLEIIEYEKLLDHYGYRDKGYDELCDKDGHEIY